jgi:tetratricopeptide (TPR) repeat protein
MILRLGQQPALCAGNVRAAKVFWKQATCATGGGRPPTFAGASASGRTDFVQAQLQRARALLDLGRPQAALSEAEKALSGGASNPQALQLHALCLLHLGRHQEAFAPLQAALAIVPTEAHLHYLLGFAWSEGATVETDPPGPSSAAKAEAAYREAQRLSPEEPVYLRALAELYVERKRLPEALILAEQAVVLGPQRASNHITLGFVVSAMGDRKRARACYEEALRIDPNNSLAWNNLGCVDLAQGRPLAARERFREALRLDPERKVATENLRNIDKKRSKRSLDIYKSFEAFEKQLLIELWEQVLFNAEATARARTHAGQPVSTPLTPRGFWRNYFWPRKPQDDPRLHALAMVWATDFRTMPILLTRMPQILVWFGASLTAAKFGPAGIAVAVGSGAATYLLSRNPLRKRHQFYVERLAQVRSRWHALQDAWLDTQIERPQRDDAIDRLIEEFNRDAEALRIRLHAEEAPE